MKIVIVGAGNMGMTMLSTITLSRKHTVVLYTEKPAGCFSPLFFRNVEKEITCEVDGFVVDSNTEAVFSDADLVFCTYPAFLRPQFVDKVAPFLKCGAMLGFVPGYGGIEYRCKPLIEKGVIVFALQRTPYVARSEVSSQEGTVASVLSSKKMLFVGAIPAKQTETVTGIVEQLLEIPATPIRNYLAITLTPSNPLLHITGIYNVFGHAEPDHVYPEQLYLYTEWTDETSDILFRYDAEVQEICRRLAPMDLSEVVSLPIYYESDTPAKMTRKLKSIKAFEVVKVPLKPCEGGYVMNLDSRMFREDFPFGVCILKAFALMTASETPVIDMMLEFYTRVSGKKYFDSNGGFAELIQQTGIPQLVGLDTPEKIREFYC